MLEVAIMLTEPASRSWFGFRFTNHHQHQHCPHESSAVAVAVSSAQVPADSCGASAQLPADCLWSICPATSTSRSFSTIAPTTLSILLNRVWAALQTVAILVAVAALDARPVLGFFALPGTMTLLVAVAAPHDSGLWALPRHMALLLAVVAGTSAAPTSAIGTGWPLDSRPCYD